MANIPTSGPWHVERTTDGRSGFTGLSIVTADGLALANLVFQLTDTERANARLMAAAPDYHEAASAMLARHDAYARERNFDSCGCDECKAFRPIVAKAEGRNVNA